MAKRKKKWPSHLKKPPRFDTVVQKDNQGNTTGIATDTPEFALFVEWLYLWAQDMHSWGADTRDDVVRLEGHAGFATGDPGDPPDGPPE